MQADNWGRETFFGSTASPNARAKQQQMTKMRRTENFAPEDDTPEAQEATISNEDSRRQHGERDQATASKDTPPSAPEGWTVHWSESTFQWFYWNVESSSSTWELPVHATAKPRAPPGWTVHWSERSERWYFRNRDTDVTTWQMFASSNEQQAPEGLATSDQREKATKKDARYQKQKTYDSTNQFSRTRGPYNTKKKKLPAAQAHADKNTDPDALKKAKKAERGTAYYFYYLKRQSELSPRPSDFVEFGKAIGAEWISMDETAKMPYFAQVSRGKVSGEEKMACKDGDGIEPSQCSGSAGQHEEEERQQGHSQEQNNQQKREEEDGDADADDDDNDDDDADADADGAVEEGQEEQEEQEEQEQEDPEQATMDPPVAAAEG
eukprot:COSAG01_NODE_10739_length_2096_cov_146.952811_1_plen_379_part_01